MKRKASTPASGEAAKKNCNDPIVSAADVLSQPGLTYELDPAGDIIFLLPNVPKSMPARLADLEPNMLGGFSELSQTPESQLSTPSAGEPTSDETPASEQVSDEPAASENESAATEESDTETPADEVPLPLRIRTSSKHLSFSCPYFSRMFNGGFKEASELESQGSVVITVEDWEALPFLLLLMVIHGKSRMIPRKVDMETLVDIAILVDFYECYEVVGVISDMWINDLLESHPLAYNDDVHSWLFISWVFARKEIFSKITQIMQVSSTEAIDSAGLLIPGVIIDQLNEGRNEGINRIIEFLHSLYSSLATNGKCNKLILSNVLGECWRTRTACKYGVIGALVTHMLSMGLLSPSPTPPFAGISVTKLIQGCGEKLQSLTHYSDQNNEYVACSISRRTQNRLSNIPQPPGLDIDNPAFVKLRGIHR
ncbi:uncharacterized protein DSM5745_10388 [Aspergillus mulundensis]|uniref:Uncharacterized protein n=1 Tax=Aspergillus mulundensis TaxID=1810919 RepID=A0A3D8QIR9_9EURO|nr:hypothetical protein DSM5745_10388 [Aspergillus mulundensis]RDW61716.1 hypothetical protein DSM5745_10388 [Aspergillus mulundensis]